MKTLSVVGTAAMFMVGGGILTHGIHFIYQWIEEVTLATAITPVIGSFMQFITPPIVNLMFGLIIGIMLVVILMLSQKIKNKLSI